MARVVVQEVLVGELRDGARVAAGLVRVGGVGEQRRGDGVVQHVHGVGKGALHLVEDHAVVAQGAVFKLAALGDVQLVVPALLLEDGGLGVDGGVEHGVHVDARQVHEVLLVSGGDRVDRLVRVGHGVEERLHGALDEVNEGLLDGIALGAAQNRVLQDVEDAGVVCGRGFETDGERLVLVLAGQVQQARARCVMAHDVGVGVELGDVLVAKDGEAVEDGVFAQKRGGALDGAGLRCGHGAPILRWRVAGGVACGARRALCGMHALGARGDAIRCEFA